VNASSLHIPDVQPLTEESPVIAKMKLFLIDDNGATAIEYGLIAAGIAVAIITVIPAIGGKLNTAFGKVSNALN
jgi:pilus assembly protein Flp/PilA